MRKLLLIGAGLVLSLGLSARAEDKVDFTKQIRPILAKNCYSCHAGAKHKGNLKLDSVESIKKGGKEGSDIVAGDPGKSDAYRRITLKPDDDDIMPPSDKGKPLTKEQTDLIKTWIVQGAEFGDWKKDEVNADGKVVEPGEKPTTAAAAADEGAPKEVALPQVAAASPAALDQLRAAGAQCLPLCQGSNLLTVEFTSTAAQITDQQVALLAQVAPQVYDLNLANTKVSDEGLKALDGMTNLHRLHLEKTAVSDAGLSHVKNLAGLEYLNLYHTAVSDVGVEQLQPLKGLKSLYLWQTKVTDTGAEGLKKANPAVNVDLGWKEPVKVEAPKEPAKEEAAKEKTADAK
jgi:hypothetical protein